MALVVGRGFLVQPCSSSFICKNVYKPLSGVTNTFWPTRPRTTRCLTQTVVRAQLRPTWLPGLDPPPYLDGRWDFHIVVHVNVHLCCFKKRKCCFWAGSLFELYFVLQFSLPGDFGFDPLGLGEDPESLKWYVQAELVHARFAMLGVAGILLTDVSSSKVSLAINHLWTSMCFGHINAKGSWFVATL